MSETHRIYINRTHLFSSHRKWTTAAGMYPHAYVPEEAYLAALARAEAAEAELERLREAAQAQLDYMDLCGHRGDLERNLRAALQSGDRDNG